MVDNSLDTVISEEEFQSVLELEAADFFRAYNFFRSKENSTPFKRFYSTLNDAAHQLESFLDDYGARNNRSYSYFTELVGVTRIVAEVAYILKHVLIRYPSYSLGDDREQFLFFHKGAEKILAFCNARLGDLLESAAREYRVVIGSSVSDEEIEIATASDEPSKKHLPHNLDEKELIHEKQKVSEIATRFLRFSEQFRGFLRDLTDQQMELDHFVLERCTEEEIEKFETSARAMQLKYDAHIKNTLSEAKNPELRPLRGHVSMVLHALEMSALLARLSSRCDSVKYESISEKVRKLVDPQTVVEYMGKYLLPNIRQYLENGDRIASQLLGEFTRVKEYTFDIPHDIVLHARPATLIVKIVNQYGTPVTMTIGGETCDAGSMIRVMMTLGNNPGVRVIRFKGDERPVEDIKLLFDHRLGEDGLERLPERLDYLKKG